MSSSSYIAHDPIEEPVPAGAASTVVKELAAGTVAGWAQVMSSDAYRGAIDCAKQLVKNEGPLAFYKGTAMPLVGIGACVSLQFAGLQAAKRFFASRNVAHGRSDPDALSPGQFYLAGAFAGLGNSFASGPVEHTQQDGRYTGPLDAIRKIYRTDGLRGVYQGQGVTLAREAHGYGVYFAVYELLVAREIKSNGLRERGELSLGKSAVFGATAGWVMWMLNYPLDVLKSRIQTDAFPSSQQRRYPRGVRDAIPGLWAEGRFGAFWRGLGPTMIRSPFVNSATFVVFELTMRLLG
ncbi:SPOSA6832_03724 [Sporobolomyces salmonicolor]|uniref:SPOSA6832_03724-mRNA-1:cds n=1 Tax=Sporidiobolus salmonicolor TaxID=5005 RepID=A0A0D6EPV3_SPOSA|nr:SPOSA6832_03724 [Sporobolomyces salmonicolor]